MKRLLFFLMAIIFAIQVFAQNVQIGSGTSTQGEIPINTNYGYTYSQQLLKSSEISASGVITSGGTISKLRYYWNGSGGFANSTQWKVYLGHTTKTEFSSTTDWVALTDLTLVYDATITPPTVAGWYTVVLQTPFVYNGTDNLIIAVDENMPSYTTSAYFYSYTSTNCGLRYRSDSNNPDPSSPPTGTRTSSVPQVKLYFQEACSSPETLSITSLNSSDVTIDWINGGLETQWNIQYKLTTDATWTAINAVSTKPYQITGLTPNSSYEVQLQSDCGSSTLSLWTSSLNFTTPAIPTQLPFTTNFEDATDNSNWQFINGTQVNKWFVGNAIDPTTGLAVDTLGTSGSLYISRNSNGDTNIYSGGSSANVSKVYAFRDFYIPTGATEVNLEFDWRANGNAATTDFLRAYLVPATAVITAGSIPPGGLDASAQIGNYVGGVGEHWLSKQTNWQHKRFRITSTQFPTLANNTWRLLIHWRNENTSGTSQPPAAVDNLNFTVSACPSPSALSVSNITTTSALLTWSENGSATDWIIEYKPSSSTTWTAYQTTSNPDSIIGLMSGTSYSARLRSLCSDTSLYYSNTITFQTLCASQTVPTPQEGFITQVPPTTCWSMFSGLLPATDTATLTSTTSGWYWNTNVTPHNAKVNLYSTGCKYWLVSPSVDLGDGSIPAQIEFDVFFTSYNNANTAGASGSDDRFAVVVSTDNGLTWNVANATIWSNAVGATRVLNNISNLPTHIILPLFDPATSLPYTGAIKVGFYGESTVSNADNDLHIDNFEVTPYTICQRPTSVTTIATSTDAVVNFTENGESTTWEYVYGEATTLTDPSAGSVVSITNDTFQLTGLSPQTQYNIWVRSVCDNGNSEWSVLSTFVTSALPAVLPYTCGFEISSENLAWKSLSNGVNKWSIGSAAGNGNSTTGTQANYISNDNGVSYAMTSGYIYSYTYRDIDFGSNLASYKLSFDWKCQGYMSTWDNSLTAGLIVYLRDPSEPINTLGLPINPNDNLVALYNSSTWQNAELPIDSLSGVKRLIFVYFDQYYNYAPPGAIDNISLVQALCPRPSSVLASNITTTSSSISWSHPGADSYIVSYKKDTIGSIFVNDAVLSSPYTIQGLTLGTSYLVSVKSICGGDTSFYSQTISFQTPCVDGAVSQYPYIDDFSSGIGCWISSSSGTAANDFWQSATSGSYPTTSPNSPSNMLYFNSYSSSETGYLISSEFNIPVSTPMAVDFWMVRDGAYASNNEYVEILVNNTQSLTGAISLGIIHRTLGMTPIETVSGWHEYLFTIPDTIVGSRYFIIKGQGDYGNNMYVDDFSVISLSCPIPSVITASNITTTTADISWTGTDNATAWNLEYKTSADATWTVVPITTNPYTIQGLVAGRSYSLRIQTDCGSNGLSNYGSSTFVTPCFSGAISSYPWIEGFENGLNCWTVTASGTASNSFWRIQTTGEYPSCTPHGGSNMVQYNSYTSPNNSGSWTVMASPSLDFNTGSDMQLSFWMYRDSGYSSYLDEGVYAYVNSTPDTVGGTLLGHISRYGATNVWDSISYTIPSTITGVKYIVLKGYSQYGNNIYIDDVTVDVSSSIPCSTPTGLTASTITNTTSTLNWTAGGSEIGWQVRQGTTGTPVDVVSTTYQAIGLTQGTAYTYYVRANCGGSYSAWVSVLFTTTSDPVLTTVATLNASLLTYNSATFNGSYLQGDDTVNAVGFRYKVSTATTWTLQAVSPLSTPFSYAATGLIPNTTYKLMAYATTNAGTNIYGDTVTFTTLALTPPTVTTDSISNVGQTSASFYGSAIQGTESIVARGFEYKKTTETWSNLVDITATGTGVITATANNLLVNTAYNVRAYAETQTGRVRGAEMQFSTINPVVLGEVTTQYASNVEATTATLNGSLVSVGGATTSIEVGFVYSTITDPEIGGANVTKVPVTYSQGMTTYNTNIIGLSPLTVYFVKSYVTNSAGTAYGTQTAFTTLSGLNDIDAKQLEVSLYPNPASTISTLKIKGIVGQAKVFVTDVQGRIINTFEVKSIDGEVTQLINVNNFAKGVYYVRIQNAKTTRTQKLIVE